MTQRIFPLRKRILNVECVMKYIGNYFVFKWIHSVGESILCLTALSSREWAIFGLKTNLVLAFDESLNIS